MKINALLLAGAALLVATGAQAQSLNGNNVGVQYYFPTQGQLYSDHGVNKVGTDGPTTAVAGIFDMTFTDSTATASNFRFDSSWTSRDFNGFRLYDADGTIGNFMVSLGASNMVGLNASRITFDANNVYVNWQGLGFNPSTSVTLNFAPVAGAVPEPATWAMMLVGFGMVGFAARRRSSVKTTVAYA